MSKLSARHWHLWVGLVLALPMLIVGITAFFIAHEKQLGLDQVEISVGWLPGAQTEMKMKKMYGPELRALYNGADGERLLATKTGVYAEQGGTLLPVAGLEGVEVRAWLVEGGVLYAAAKQGLYRREQGQWRPVLRQELLHVAAAAGGGLEAVGRNMLWRSADGRDWREDDSVQRLFAALPPTQYLEEPYTLKKLNMDLHTGKAFFGKEWEVIWIDIVGLSLALLTLTGVWVWWRRRAA